MGLSPSPTDDPDKIRRARAIATLQPAIQKVEGDARTAENSFLKINSNPATIDPTDLDLIRARKKPNAIATRALMRAGTDYYAKLAKVKEIDSLAKEVHGIVFGPILDLNTRSPDVPRAGQPYSNEAFKMVLDMVNMFNDVTPAMWQEQKTVSSNKVQVLQLQDDTDGSMTLRYLKRVKDVGTLVSDNGERNSGSLGLDQAVYSYGATGKFHPGAFLAALKLAQELKIKKNLGQFTKVRKDFEDFLVRHKIFINQIGRSKGSRTRPVESVLQMHRIIIECLQSGVHEDKKIIRKLKRDKRLEELKDVTNIPKDETKRKQFSKSVQEAGVIRSVLDSRERCKVCGARLPPSCRSKDHKQRKVDRGTGSLENLQFTHPYCNTGYKEKTLSQFAKDAKNEN
jgi:HNH endonuclease